MSPKGRDVCRPVCMSGSKHEEPFNSSYQAPRFSDGSANEILLPNSSPSATVTELLRELQQNLSDDFNKKLEEWQRCRTGGHPEESLC
ncbi:uncharacterized protein CEXT_163031 [Caerostris extrusa]|uniref:Uncharacterized protein n=1 Tax=Caerostris extrusa TaxID=172846 RepID=A0AAV4Y9P7_CAEEX|nr:uncharacterized protein CEXT_163031 [Caerostris extrusa]